MNDSPSEASESYQTPRKPNPWEQQPGERLDRYRWFQIFLILPFPRRLATVARIVNLKPGSKLVRTAARRWRWQERAAGSDSPDSGCPALQKEWRNQLLREAAYLVRFVSLEETNRALAGTAIGDMDRVVARRHLDSLFRHQQGLLRLIAPLLKSEKLEIDEDWLEGQVYARAREINWIEELKTMYEVWGEDGSTASTEPGRDGSPDTEDSSTSSQEPNGLDEEAGESEPWRRQPGESDNHYDWFRIYLSLMFWQSTEQVARMVKVVRSATLAKIARKWRWQERAAAFEESHIDQPLARPELQDQLLFDRTFDSLLFGLLESTMAIRNAEIDRMNRVRARRSFSTLSRHQRNLLRSIWRRDDAAAREALEERRALLVAPLVDERAVPLAEELAAEDDVMLQKIFGNPEEDE